MAALATAPARPDREVPDGYYTVEEAAERLRIGTRALRDGFNHKGWPGARIGGRLVWNDGDLAEIYRMHRAPARSVPRRSRRAA